MAELSWKCKQEDGAAEGRTMEMQPGSALIVDYFVFVGKYKKLVQGTKQNLGSCSEARLWLHQGLSAGNRRETPHKHS